MIDQALTTFSRTNNVENNSDLSEKKVLFEDHSVEASFIPKKTPESEKQSSDSSKLNLGYADQTISSISNAVLSSSTSSPSSALSTEPKKEEETKESLEPRINVISSVKISPDKITMGQGEYVVFHQLPNGETKRISRELYEQVYKILNQYSPSGIVNKGSDKIAEDCAKRYELIKAKLKEIDSSLEVVFIPRTLYELIFLRKIIKEDLKHNKDNKCCPYFQALTQSVQPNDIQEQSKVTRKCWHLAHFMDAGDNNHLGVKELAYRLNQIIIRTFSPTAAGFTHKEFTIFAEKEIDFLKNYYKKGKNHEIDGVDNCSFAGPSSCFGFESNRGSIRPMGIRDDWDAQILRNAIALDCSEIAKDSFLIFRGAKFKKDRPINTTGLDQPYSLSYGSSLFAGCVFDADATAFFYMRNDKLNAYAISVPFNRLKHSSFYIPLTNTVVQLFGLGEIFHVRTKAWKDFDVKKMGGIQGLNGNKREHLTSNLTQDEFIKQFQQYKNQSIQLKPMPAK